MALLHPRPPSQLYSAPPIRQPGSASARVEREMRRELQAFRGVGGEMQGGEVAAKVQFAVPPPPLLTCNPCETPPPAGPSSSARRVAGSRGRARTTPIMVHPLQGLQAASHLWRSGGGRDGGRRGVRSGRVAGVMGGFATSLRLKLVAWWAYRIAILHVVACAA